MHRSSQMTGEGERLVEIHQIGPQIDQPIEHGRVTAHISDHASYVRPTQGGDLMQWVIWQELDHTG